jgi:hypothetical protein
VQGLTLKLFRQLRKQHAYSVMLAMEAAAKPLYQAASDAYAPAVHPSHCH